MKTFCGLVVIASAIGCGTDTLPEMGETQQAVTRQCIDDPLLCTRGNGGGVYTQEMGNAGIGPRNFMITHFINNLVGTSSPYVTIQGRYQDSTSHEYVVGNAEIISANLDAALATPTGTLPIGDYDITEVDETLTVPSFTLKARNGSGVSGTISNAQLNHMSIGLKLPGGTFTVSFAKEDGLTIPFPTTAPPSNMTTGTGANIVLAQFDMWWNAGTTVSPSTRVSYCTLAPATSTATVGDPDPVVFQQGIVVNALNAVLNQNDNYTTLSCRNGAIATVRWWGYIYHGTTAQANLFETAMHMKRASYCGDESFFTRRNTDILINDQHANGAPSINNDGGITWAGLEATWGYDGATGTFRALCVNLGNLRRPNAGYVPVKWGGTGDVFDGTCASGPSIPVFAGYGCPLTPASNPGQWLIEQKSP